VDVERLLVKSLYPTPELCDRTFTVSCLALFRFTSNHSRPYHLSAVIRHRFVKVLRLPGTLSIHSSTDPFEGFLQDQSHRFHLYYTIGDLSELISHVSSASDYFFLYLK